MKRRSLTRSTRPGGHAGPSVGPSVGRSAGPPAGPSGRFRAQRVGNSANFGLTVHGANHNFLNSRWAPGPGRPGSEDDAGHPDGRPGKCYAWDPDELTDTLRKGPEQEVARTYVHAFFARYLRHDTRFGAVLSGKRHPARDLTRVDARRYRPAGGA